MPQSLSAVYIHAVFSTKDRRPFLKDDANRVALNAYISEVSHQLDCPAIISNCMEDHIHILVRFGRTATQAGWIKEIKRVTSIWIKAKDSTLRDFYWQSGYGSFSVDPLNLEIVTNYIATQAEHHRKTTFQDEYRMLLKQHNIEWDERYVWD